MNRIHLVAVAACSAALGIVACRDRSPDRASETNTTSAPLPADPQTTAYVPTGATIELDEARDGGQQSQVGHSGHAAYDTAGDDARDAGHSALSDLAAVKDAGHASVAAAKDAGHGNVAPGHIMFPPETTGRATGSPSSNGSHDVGAGGALVR